MTSNVTNESVTDYKVIYDESVTEYLRKGWELYGYPFCHNNGGVMQAIILRKKRNG